MTGFLIFDLGGILGIVSLVLGLIGLARNSGAARSMALRGAVLGGVIALIFVGLASRSGGVPRINDITTDMDKPPRFVAAQKIPENEDRDLTYPGPSFAEQQRAGYPDLSPLPLAMPPAEAYAKVKAAASTMPTWQITRDDPQAMAIEGVATTWLFRFQDDFVIEVRPDVGGGSLVQMRSKSRDGQGDVGANAARIRAYFAALKP
jgi:uncharacterized protein (DUF1499 family)